MHSRLPPLTPAEHFSTPLHFAKQHYGLSSTLLPFPSGTGAMVAALQSHEIDIGIGLTEGWIAALGKAQAAQQDPGFSLVGTYVETPLCWAISTGPQRADISSVAHLHGKKVGVSRVGSGSYIMSYVLADQQGWLDSSSSEVRQAPFPVEELHTFAALRAGVTDGTADFFMWEHFTSKRYHDNGALKRIGEIHTPWSSWKIVARSDLVRSATQSASSGAPHELLQDVFDKLNLGVAHFEANPEEAVRYISSQLEYSEEDARAWLRTVRFARETRGVGDGVVEMTVGVLQKAGVLGREVRLGDMNPLKRG